MKRLLGSSLPASLLVLVLLLAGCGSESSSTADEPAPTTSGPTTSDPTTSASTEPQTVGIVSATAAGGRVDLNAVPIDDDQSRQAFAAQFEQAAMDERLLQVIGSATVPESYTLVAAVVAIGCDVPTSVTATQKDEGWVLEPVMPGKTMQECFAPVTSVAVVAVPE